MLLREEEEKMMSGELFLVEAFLCPVFSGGCLLDDDTSLKENVLLYLFNFPFPPSHRLPSAFNLFIKKKLFFF